MKLNVKNNRETYLIEEKVTMIGGEYKGVLKHGNVLMDTVSVNTRSNREGENIMSFNISKNKKKSWKTDINIFAKDSTLYISYETIGDQIDADDINDLEKSIGDLEKLETIEKIDVVNAINEVNKSRGDIVVKDNRQRLLDCDLLFKSGIYYDRYIKNIPMRDISLPYCVQVYNQGEYTLQIAISYSEETDYDSEKIFYRTYKPKNREWQPWIMVSSADAMRSDMTFTSGVTKDKCVILAGSGTSSGEYSAILASYLSESEGNYTSVLASKISMVKGNYSSVIVSEWGEIIGEYSVILASSRANIKDEASFSCISNSYFGNISNGKYKNLTGSLSTSAEGIGDFQSAISTRSCKTGNGDGIQILSSKNVTGVTPWSTTWGYGESAQASSQNRKVEIQSKTGNVLATGSITGNSSFADFAEYMESSSGQAISLGTIVSMDEKQKIKIAQAGENPVGVISGTAGIILNAQGFEHKEKYLYDRYGQPIYVEKDIVDDKLLFDLYSKEVEKEENLTIDDFKNSIENLPVKKSRVRQLNINWDDEVDYISRSERPEWNVVGMKGQIYVNVDESVKEGGYIAIGKDGIGTDGIVEVDYNGVKAHKLWQVMEITTPYSSEIGFGIARVII